MTKEKDERWQTTQNGSLSYILFLKHFTEINNAYWAFRPAANTIVRFARDEIKGKAVAPLDFFYIEEEHERRLDNSYQQWHDNFNIFSQYTRLNFLMMLSSCFETYYRSVLALSLESKPGTVLGLDDEIDGVFILKKDLRYGDNSHDNYKFAGIIDSLCKGPWDQRIKGFKKYFRMFPSSIDTQLLEEFRIKRNEYGHFFGRSKADYENPLQLFPTPIKSISEQKLLQYFKLIFDSVSDIDQYLYTNYIGSYDIIKLYFQKIYKSQTGKLLDPIEQARLLRKELGTAGLKTAGTTFYDNLFSYICLDDRADACRYPQKSCIKEINKLIAQENYNVTSLGKGKIFFSQKDFKNYCKKHLIYENELYCKKHNFGYDNFLFSYKIVEDIIKIIKTNPMQYFKKSRNA